jgi:uncharacterized membrane-anchored protein
MRIAKVPEITLWFWSIKILTTGMGETTSDWLAHRFDPVVAVGIGGLALLVALWIQFRTKKYIAWAYWLAVAMVSIFGTMAADVLRIGLGIPYLISTICYAAVLAGIFAWWYKSEKTLSIHSITTRRREWFYWATVLTTFALGTATGDMTATTLHLGYLSSGILFAVCIALPALAYRMHWLGEVASFWIAYILTRPLGASFSDWAAVSQSRGGLAFGTGIISILLTVLIILLIVWLSVSPPNPKISRIEP